MFNKRVHLLVKGVLMLSRCAVQQQTKKYALVCCLIMDPLWLCVQNIWEKCIYEMLHKKKLKVMSTESTIRFTYTWCTNNCKMWAQMKHVEVFYNFSTKIIYIQARLGNLTIMLACKVYTDLIWDTVTECMKGCSLPPPYKWPNEWKNEWMNACMCVRMHIRMHIYK
jgi:hypothetical protein